ncbi:MAG: hypothetical protein HFJ75_07665 [Eggerthellaceae bacterium]|nr:hypothetical protein [Eggerthellaceae bacterium]
MDRTCGSCISYYGGECEWYELVDGQEVHRVVSPGTPACEDWEEAPDITERQGRIDDLRGWASSSMECCDEPEYALFSTIVDAIEAYRREKGYAASSGDRATDEG